MTVLSAQRRARSRFPLLAAAGGVSVILLTAACGGGSSGGDTGSGTATTGTSSSGGDSAVLGPAKAATLAPVKIGFASDGQTSAYDTTGEFKGALAAAAYANARLGGFGGHKIDVVTCSTLGSPATAQACGNTFVKQGVIAANAGSPGQTDPWLKAVLAAGIPGTLNLASTQTALGAPGAFVFNNPLASFGTAAAFARNNHYKSAAVLVIDVPAASGPAKQLFPLFFGNVGAKVNVVPIAPGTADMTPQIQAVEAKKPQMIHIIGDPTFCSSAIKAIRTLGITTPITALDRCIGADKGASIPGGFKGVNIIAQANVDANQKEDQLFKAVLKAYGNGIPPDAYAISGYQGMLSLIRAFNASGSTTATAKGVTAALKSMPPTPYPLGGGAQFQCNGKALPGLAPNVCFTSGFIADSTSDGTLSNFRSLDLNGVFKLPAAG